MTSSSSSSPQSTLFISSSPPSQFDSQIPKLTTQIRANPWIGCLLRSPPRRAPLPSSGTGPTPPCRAPPPARYPPPRLIREGGGRRSEAGRRKEEVVVGRWGARWKGAGWSSSASRTTTGSTACARPTPSSPASSSPARSAASASSAAGELAGVAPPLPLPLSLYCKKKKKSMEAHSSKLVRAFLLLDYFLQKDSLLFFGSSNYNYNLQFNHTIGCWLICAKLVLFYVGGEFFWCPYGFSISVYGKQRCYLSTIGTVCVCEWWILLHGWVTLQWVFFSSFSMVLVLCLHFWDWALLCSEPVITVFQSLKLLLCV